MFDNFLNVLFGNNNTSNGTGLFGFKPRSRNANKFVYQLIPFEQAKVMIESRQVLLLDVRSKGEYDIMHIVNSINMPVNEIEKHILRYEQNTPIMVYCSSGSRSKNAILILNSLGYNNIYIWEYGALATFPYKNMIEYNSEPLNSNG